MNDNIKLRELLVSQIEFSDNFRMNTEKTLNKIKDEYRTMVKELEALKKKSNGKDEQINLIGDGKKSGNNNNNQKAGGDIMPLKVNLIK